MKLLIGLIFLFSSSAWASEGSVRETLYSLRPNTIVADVAQNQTEVQLKDRDSLTTQNRPISEAGGISQLINAVSITTTPPSDEPSGFQFKWTPIFTFAFNNLKFDSPAAYLSNTDFQIFRTSLGFGPEVSYKTGLGTVYFNLTPGVAYSWVSWSSPASGGEMNRTNLNLALSVGTFNYFTPRWVLRLFIKQVYEDTKVWNEALDSSQGFDVPVREVTNRVIGCSVGYVF